jgi:hypothetical protein
MVVLLCSGTQQRNDQEVVPIICMHSSCSNSAAGSEAGKRLQHIISLFNASLLQCQHKQNGVQLQASHVMVLSSDMLVLPYINVYPCCSSVQQSCGGKR